MNRNKLGRIAHSPSAWGCRLDRLRRLLESRFLLSLKSPVPTLRNSVGTGVIPARTVICKFEILRFLTVHLEQAPPNGLSYSSTILGQSLIRHSAIPRSPTVGLGQGCCLILCLGQSHLGRG